MNAASRNPVPVSRSEAEQNARLIVQMAQLGHDSLQNWSEERFRSGERRTELERERKRLVQLAESRGWSSVMPHLTSTDSVLRIRRVAREYSIEDMRTIAAAVRKHHSRFSMSHLHRLMGVKSRRERDRLMQQAIRKSWSMRMVHIHVQQAQPTRRRSVGRKPLPPANPELALIQLETLTKKWQRWTQSAQSTLPTDVNEIVKRIQPQLKRLLEQIQSHRQEE